MAITDSGYNQVLYNQLKSTGVWANKGAIGYVDLEVSEILRNNTQQTQGQVGLNDQLRFYAWIDSRQQLRASVYDRQNFSSMTTDTLIASGANVKMPHFATVKGTTLLFYINDSEKLCVRKWNGISFEGEQVLDGAATFKIFNVIEIKNTENETIRALAIAGNAYLVDENGTLVDDNDVSPELSAILGPVDDIEYAAISATRNNITSKTHILWSVNYSQGGTDYNRVVSTAVNVSTNEVQTNSGVYFDIEDFTLSAADSPRCKNLTVYNIRSDRDIKFLYEVSAPSVKDHYIKIGSLLSTGALSGATSVYLRGVGLASQAFTLNQTTDFGRVYVVNQSSLQSTYFLVKSTLASGNGSAFIMGKCLYGQAVGLKTDKFLPTPVLLETGKAIVAQTLNTKFVSENGSEFTLSGICQIQSDFNAVPQIREFADVAWISGGMQYIYDGNAVVESGFNFFPEDVVCESGAETGGMSNGRYLYSVVWAWTDNAGNVHRSVPSIPVAITLDSATTTQTVDLTIPTLKITRKTAPRAEVVAEVYRTENNGSVFYRVSSITSPVYNDPSVSTITFNDTLADASIIANQPLYTTGDVLENVAPPQGALTLIGKNRIFVLSGDDPYLFWASKAYEKYTHPGFNEVNQIRIPSEGGKITAAIEMDEKIIVFKKDKIYYFNGDGPSNTGNGLFGSVENISASLGCISKNAICLTPQGIFFSTSKGIWLLDRGLNLTYIGAKIEKFNTDVVQTIDFVENKNQVRILTNLRCLVYDTLMGLWAVFTIAGKSATICDGVYHYVNNGSRHYAEVEDYYYDEGGAYSLKIETGWINFNGLQNYMRVYRMFLLGSYYSSHGLNIKMYYNYKIVEEDESTFNTAGALNESLYGLGSDPYGEDEKYGGNDTDNTYQFRKHMKIQQCQSIKFILEDTRNAEATPQANNKGFSINEIMLEVGIKNGQMRLKKNRTIV